MLCRFGFVRYDWNFKFIDLRLVVVAAPGTCWEDDVILVGAVEGVDNCGCRGPALLVHGLAQLHQVLHGGPASHVYVH